MPKRDLPPLSDSQQEIMEIVWELNEATVSEVLDVLQQRRDVSRNTVSTLMTRMEEKGWLTHRVSRNTFVYRAVEEKSKSLGRAARQLLNRLFEGSAEKMVNSLLEDHPLTSREADRIREIIAQAEAKRKPRKKK